MCVRLKPPSVWQFVSHPQEADRLLGTLVLLSFLASYVSGGDSVIRLLAEYSVPTLSTDGLRIHLRMDPQRPPGRQASARIMTRIQ